MQLSSFVRFLSLLAFAAFSFVLVGVGCGRTSLEPETLGEGGTQIGNCGPSTCPTGCCDATGTCRTGADSRACGAAGGRCSDCVAQGFQFCDGRRACGKSVSVCDATTCSNGCCSKDAAGRPACLQGIDGAACGRAAAACSDCTAQGRACDPATRSCGAGKCDASNCNGCCVGDKCLTGVDRQACGAKGEACKDCGATGQNCSGFATSGGQCTGTPTCGPANCGGCCQGNTCVIGADSVACGKGGQACADCSATGKTCAPLGDPNERTCQTPTCNPGNCPNGCCSGTSCINPATPTACGKSGVACVACGVNETCTNGVCVPSGTCDNVTCAGCCVGNVCAPGDQNTACGTLGVACQNCTGAGGQVCQGGTCQTPTCGPGNCPNGCCSGNTCVQGVQDSACGKGGGACNDCGVGGEVCVGQACVIKCGPGNCAGCCQGNSCAPGITKSICGSDGATCANCNGTGSVCDTSATPRVCTATNSCPAVYGGCAAGVTTVPPPTLQGLCDDAIDLDAIRDACAGGADTTACEDAFAVLATTNPNCATCLQPFDVPFTYGYGLWRCVSPQVNNACNHQTGCATQCATTSCDNCPSSSEATCVNTVNGTGGACRTFAVQSLACAAPRLAPGQLCSPASYANFGGWLRAVGDHFCGDGP